MDEKNEMNFRSFMGDVFRRQKELNPDKKPMSIS